MTTVMQPGMQMGVQPGMQQVAVGNGKEVAPLVPGGAHHPRSRSISLSIAVWFRANSFTPVVCCAQVKRLQVKGHRRQRPAARRRSGCCTS